MRLGLRKYRYGPGQLWGLRCSLRDGAGLFGWEMRAIVRWRDHQVWQRLRDDEYRSRQLRSVLECMPERSGLFGWQVRD